MIQIGLCRLFWERVEVLQGCVHYVIGRTHLLEYTSESNHFLDFLFWEPSVSFKMRINQRDSHIPSQYGDPFCLQDKWGKPFLAERSQTLCHPLESCIIHHQFFMLVIFSRNWGIELSYMFLFSSWYFISYQTVINFHPTCLLP